MTAEEALNAMRMLDEPVLDSFGDSHRYDPDSRRVVSGNARGECSLIPMVWLACNCGNEFSSVEEA